MQLYGRVLWWDEKKLYGVIKDPEGNRYYFDISVLSISKNTKIKSGLIVRFEVNTKITTALCAHRVAPASSREQSKHRRAVEQKRQLELSF